jgi:hypothetical protein
MCNLYSITTNQAAIIALFRVVKPRGFGYRLGEHASNREITALGSIRGSGASAQCEDLDTGESGLRVR